jgi:hypothetical protein
MKPSEKRAQLAKSGRTILRPMLRKVNGEIRHVITCYDEHTGGWIHWWGGHSITSTQEEAYQIIERTVSNYPDSYVDDRTII